MKYVCQICNYVYDEEAEGVPFADLPDDWTCPLCGVPKDEFAPEEDPPAPSCRSTGNGKGEGFFALSLSLLPQAGTQGGERRTPPGVRGFRFFRARESNAYGAENGQGGDGPALFRIRERKSPSGVLTNPSFPCKMKGVPDAVRAAGGRFSARSLSP